MLRDSTFTWVKTFSITVRCLALGFERRFEVKKFNSWNPANKNVCLQVANKEIVSYQNDGYVQMLHLIWYYDRLEWKKRTYYYLSTRWQDTLTKAAH